MKVVIDTNVLLSSISVSSKYHIICQSLIPGIIKLLISTEIYFEYIEILERRASALAVEFFEGAILRDDNVEVVDIHYAWNLIAADPDDNKFVDCAIAGSADYLVTNDNHFGILKTVPFPKVNVISADDFLNILNM
jgi:uncharacterized protein